MITSTPNRATTGKLLAIAVLLAALTASLMLAAKPAHASTTFTVNSTADHSDANLGISACDTGYTVTGAGGEQEAECTLRAAIQQANYTSGADTINFAIPGSGVKTIAPGSALPTITGPMSINGYSQPGASPNTKAVGSDAVLKIELSGQSAGLNVSGLRIEAANSTVRGLIVNRWIGTGIRINGSSATGNKVNGNYLGTDASGTQDLGNNDHGVSIEGAPNNAIGGATAAERNVISGNSSDGVYIFGANATGNKVSGNYVGVDASGTKALPNTSPGVYIDGAPNNAIGGATAGERNVISGNYDDGVYIFGADATGNKIVGNFIGTDRNGTAPLDNSGSGVHIYDAPNTTVGGTQAGERNVISGNYDDGVRISDAGGNRVLGNYVGTDASGTRDLGNGHDGLSISGANNTVGGSTGGARNVISGNNGEGVVISGNGATNNKVVGNYLGTDKNGTADLGNSLDGVFIYEAPNNAIGGTQAGERNVISGNGYEGVAIYGNGATGNRVLSNSIFSNDEQGIDLNADGPTANDPKDPDAGPNNLQNKPVLSSAKKTATGTTTVRGTLNSTPGKTFQLQFFSNPEGTDEGKTLLSSTTVSTSGTGNVSFSFSTTKAIRLGQNITATATNTSTGDTSEFSAPRMVVAQ